MSKNQEEEKPSATIITKTAILMMATANRQHLPYSYYDTCYWCATYFSNARIPTYKLVIIAAPLVFVIMAKLQKPAIYFSPLFS